MNATATNPTKAPKVLHFNKVEDGKLFYTVNAGKTMWWRKITEDQKEVRHYKHVYALDTAHKTLCPLRPFDDEATETVVEKSEFELRVEAGLSNRLDGVDYQAKMVDGVLTKICLCCNEPKEVALFSNLKRSKDGKLNNCKSCEITRKAKKA